MKIIEIAEEFEDSESVAEGLRHIAELIERGFRSGYDPEWTLLGDDKEDQSFLTPDQD